MSFRSRLGIVGSFLDSLLITARVRHIMSASPDNRSPPGLLRILEGNPKRLKRIRFLSELFKTHGFELRIAGGAVRDILRGKEPKDIDFATTARPDESLKIVKRHEDVLRIIVTTAGQRHGTIAVKFKEIDIDFKKIKLDHNDDHHERGDKVNGQEPEYDEESPYEITTLRCDKLTDGRHAEVEFINDWHKDAERRDLTINAMFLTLDDGRLIDYYNGESDLDQGIVRFVGDADTRIKEDYLRILRFFRFWSRYGMGKRPDEATLDVIRENLSGLNQISGERIWQEIKKILSYLPCSQVFELMLDLRVFDYAGLLDDDLIDYTEYSKRVLQEVNVIEDNIQRYRHDVLEARSGECDDQAVKRLEEFTPVILFAAAVQTETLCLNAYKRVRFSNFERDTILYMIENKNRSVPLETFKYQLAVAPVPERHIVLQRMRAYLISRGLFENIDVLENWDVPKFPLNGSVVAKAVKARKLPFHKTKDILEEIKLEWAKQDFDASETEIRQWMSDILDRLQSESCTQVEAK